MQLAVAPREILDRKITTVTVVQQRSRTAITSVAFGVSVDRQARAHANAVATDVARMTEHGEMLAKLVIRAIMGRRVCVTSY